MSRATRSLLLEVARISVRKDALSYFTPPGRLRWLGERSNADRRKSVRGSVNPATAAITGCDNVWLPFERGRKGSEVTFVDCSNLVTKPFASEVAGCLVQVFAARGFFSYSNLEIR